MIMMTKRPMDLITENDKPLFSIQNKKELTMLIRTAMTVLVLFVISILGACGQSESEPTSVNNITVSNESNASIENISVEKGESLYESNCSSCHGIDGKGLTGLGKNLVEGEFFSQMPTNDLIDFIIVGREPSDPENSTGISMPPKGGNPALSDEDLSNIIAYVRILNK